MKKGHAIDIPETLRLRGLKATPRRVALLDALGRARTPLGTSELAEAVAHTRMDTVTLYRALEALVAAGLVRQVDLRHGHTDYELVREDGHHHHLVCTNCGALEDIESCPSAATEVRILEQTKRFTVLTDHSSDSSGCASRALNHHLISMTVFLIGIAAALSTFVGGSLALRFKKHIHLILGFSAGAVVSVALIDLLPEALSMGEPFHALSTMTSVAVLGFVAYMMLDRISLVLTAEGSEHRGHMGAGSLTVHSFLDGIAIGLAFQVSAALGAVVAIAVLVHDFSDGINTVNLSLLGTGKPHIARGWLIADALAPIAGIAATFLFHVPEQYLCLVLALFSGFFLYIGASELLPESHHRYPRIWTSLMTVLGVVVMFVAISIAG